MALSGVFDGTGKSLFLLNGAPLPVAVLNLDRPITSALIKEISPDRLPSIRIKNMRENLDDLDQLRSLQIKEGIESVIRRNKEFLRGGSIIIDGGSTFRDIIKLLFHFCGELHIDDIGKVFDKHVVDDFSRVSRLKIPSLIALDISAVLNGRDNRRIGRRPADAVFFQNFYE